MPDEPLEQTGGRGERVGRPAAAGDETLRRALVIDEVFALIGRKNCLTASRRVPACLDIPQVLAYTVSRRLWLVYHVNRTKTGHGAKHTVHQARNPLGAAAARDRGKPYAERIAPGIRLGYRRTRTAGTWSVLVADGAGGNWLRQFAFADDYETSDGARILDYWQAQDRARVLARGDQSDRPATVSHVIDQYEKDLQSRGADPHNASRLRARVPAALAGRTAALLTARELRRWRDDLLAQGSTASTVRRVSKVFKAALNAAAAHDPRIANGATWSVGLASLPDSEHPRNVILNEAEVRAIVSAGYAINRHVGLMIETAAVTGARSSQLARLTVGDLQADQPDPRLMMPSARKGRASKRVTRSPVPIPAGLAALLREAGAGRPADAPLLCKPSGEPWRPADHRRPFRDAACAAGLDASTVTIYALRHTSIVRQLLANVPARIVAGHHDTSIVMLERNYSAQIGEHSDAVIRRALLDLAPPPAPAGNVVVLGKP